MLIQKKGRVTSLNVCRRLVVDLVTRFTLQHLFRFPASSSCKTKTIILVVFNYHLIILSPIVPTFGRAKTLSHAKTFSRSKTFSRAKTFGRAMTLNRGKTICHSKKFSLAKTVFARRGEVYMLDVYMVLWAQFSSEIPFVTYTQLTGHTLVWWGSL